MKKLIIILASILSVVLLAALVIPIIFKDDIQRQVSKALDDNLDARVYFEPSKFGLTLFKNFPNPTASIEDFGIIGVGQFDGDTLMSVGNFNITIDIFSLFGDRYKISSINLENPRINVIVLENGVANYEIVTDPAEGPEGVDDTETSEFNISINQWNISNGRLSYVDKSMDMSLLFQGLNHLGSGDISSDEFDLATFSEIDNAVISWEGINYLTGQKLYADLTLNINMDEYKFTFRQNEIRINDFPLAFDGWLAMPSEDMEMDISFSSVNSSIKSLYSLIPGVFTEEYDGISAAGEMSFSGYIKGMYNESSLPAYHVELLAKNGLIAYPDLPTPVKNINFDVMVDCSDGNIENTLIEIREMHLDIGSNPIDGTMIIRNLKDYSMKADVSAKLELAELNSIFPIEGLDMKGLMSLDLKADGIYDSIRNIMPSISANLNMKNGYIKSSEFPKALEDITFKSNIESPSGKMEEVVLNVDNFKLAMEGEELTGKLHLKNLVDYEWDLMLKGGVDLEVISEVYPIEGMKYDGHLKADIETKGKFSDVEAERYDRFPTTGIVELTDFNFTSKDLPQSMNIIESKVMLNPRELEINSFVGTIGRSDLKLGGVVKNYIGYVFEDNALLSGKMDLNSNILDINEWMNRDETQAGVTEDTIEMELVQIPRNIDFEFNSIIKNIYYDNLNLKNAKGLLTIRDGVLDMNNLSFDLLGGAVVMNGKYDTRKPEKPSFNYQLNISSLSIPQAFSSFSTVQTFAPIAQHMNGSFSTKFSISGLLKEDMSPVYESLNGKGLIQIAEAFVKESQLVSGISGFMTTGLESNQLSLKDVIMKASIENGRAYVAPFDIALGGQKANISGSIGADGTLDYFLSTEVEAGIVGQQVNQLIAGLRGDDATAASSKIKLNFNIGGTYEEPKISLAGTTSEDGTTTTVKEQVQQEVKAEVDQKVEEVKTEAEERAQEETEKLIKEGEEQLQPQIDTLKKKISENLEEEAGEILSDELDSTANELKESLQNLFRKKKNK